MHRCAHLVGLRDTRVPMLIAGLSFLVIGFPSAFYKAFIPCFGETVSGGVY